MKKVLLSSVAALAVFAAAAPVFAADEIPFGGPNGDQVNIRGWVDNGTEASLDEARVFGNESQKENSKAKTGAANNAVVEPKKDKNGKVIENEFVLREKGPKAAPAKDAAKPAGKDAAKPGAAKSSAAAGQKALPKTSAVK